MPVGETIARNTIFNGLGRAWEAIVSLVLVAYIVSRIGVEQYGLWAIVGAFTGYAALFDLGIGSAYAKYIAEHAARDERERISSVVSTGLFYYLAFGGVFVLAGWLAVDGLIGLLSRWGAAGALGSEAVTANLRFLMRWTLVLFAASNCLAPFTAVQTGLQRMGVTNVVGVTASLIKVGATVAFLEAGYGIRGLVYANATVLAGFGIATLAGSLYVCPWLRVAPWRASWAMFRRLFAYGWRTQVSRLSNLVTFETDVLIITLVLRDLELVGLYKIGLELANKMRQVPVVLISALMPAAAELHALRDTARLRRLYLRSTKYVAALTVPLAVFFAGSAGLLMTAWQGTALELGVAAGVLRVLALGYVANILPGPGVAVALGMGRPGIQMIAGLISMTSNVVLTVGFALAFGFWGVPLATALSMGLSWAWFSRAIGRSLDVRSGETARQALLGPIQAVAGPAAFVVACDALSFGVDTRVGALAVLLAALTVFVGLYLTLLRRTAFFDAADLHFFEKVLKLNRVPGYAAWTRPLRQG